MKQNYKYYERRRKRFVAQLPENSLVIIPNKKAQMRSKDVGFKFKPDNDFFYLTGFDEPGSICVLKKEKSKHSFTLFLKARDKQKEIWVGKKTGITGAKTIFKADEAYPITEFWDKIKKIIPNTDYIYFPIGVNRDLDLKITEFFQELRNMNRLGINPPKAIFDPRDIIHKMRLVKDSFEISLMKRAAEISRDAHIFAMSYAKPGMFEHELEAIIEFKFRSQGAYYPAYPSIIGSGNNSTILHYIKNNKKIKKTDLILIDAGCEFDYYASDITRTFPANKKFTPAQKAVYEIVLEAQLKAIETMKPGKSFKDVHNKALSIIISGLKELKLLKGNKEEIIKKKKIKKFFMHNIGHWLGLDVHDVGPYMDDKKKSIRLVPGMVMTAEPGIYISHDLDDVPNEFKGIGIRIEDDILITNNGNNVLTSGTPKTIREIESLA